MPSFAISHQDPLSQARCGILETPHGRVQTPVFMPIGTAGAVKGILPEQLKTLGTEIILANTYHFIVRPGVEVVEGIGGLHSFMAWDRPILTDSGGYQVFSLSTLNQVDDQGVSFASHVDGQRFYLDAQTAIRIQDRLGADIIMCFDQCTPYPCERTALETAVRRTVHWAAQCKQAHANQGQMLFGIVQGGIDKELRSQCAVALVELDFPGYAIGGLSVGEGHEPMIATVEHTAPLLPPEKPRYLMGVGMPADIIAAVRVGVDMFDCVLPTRNGRNAYAFTADGPLRLRNAIHIDSDEPIEKACECYACRHYCRAAIRHFFNCGEMLGPILLSIHNVMFYQKLMHRIRSVIQEGTFSAWARQSLKHYQEVYGTDS
jgi:queuine tRNA-ribosyltransferase